MTPFERELSGGGSQRAALVDRDDPVSCEAVATGVCLEGNVPQVATDACQRIREFTEALKLGVVTVAGRSPSQDCLRQERLAPDCDQSLPVELMWV